MKQAEASSTAKAIAAATLLLDSDRRTAGLVAPRAAQLCRRLLSRTRADRLLAASAVHPVPRALWRWMERLTHPGIMCHYWYRKRWIEARCRAAIAEGFERVVVLGAGFDTLACRLKTEARGVELLEVDHPATQQAKREALAGESAGIRFSELDLEREDIPSGLARDSKSTLVIAEGLLMYLSPANVDRLFESLRTMAAGRLRIVFSFMSRWPDGTTGFLPRSWLVEQWLRWRGEPFTWALEPAAIRDFLAQRGFRLVELALTRELSAGASVLDGENLVICELN